MPDLNDIIKSLRDRLDLFEKDEGSIRLLSADEAEWAELLNAAERWARIVAVAESARASGRQPPDLEDAIESVERDQGKGRGDV